MYGYNRRRHDGVEIARCEQQGPGGQPLQVQTTDRFFKHDFILSLIPCSVAGSRIQGQKDS
jgi:hypothetical protein